MAGSMIKIRRHVPNFVQVDDDFQWEYEVRSMDDLRALPWVKEWTDDPFFYRLSLSDEHLMAETYQGAKWWVLGSLISGRESLNLPEWRRPRD